MPSISDSHVLAARAVTRIQSILAAADALSGVITHDYGEDLLVQTRHQSQADPFNIFIQAKGTLLQKHKDGKYRYRVDVGHLYRWVSHIYPVILCVYDDCTKRVYAVDPAEKFSLWHLSTSRYNSVTIPFSEKDRFTKRTAAHFIWRCRLRYFSDLLALAENRHSYVFGEPSLKKASKNQRREINLISMRFLEGLGIIAGDSIDEKFRKAVRRVADYFPERFGATATLRDVFGLLVLAEMQDVSNYGGPPNLLEHGVQMAGYIFKSFHPQEWAEATNKFSVKWEPYAPIAGD